MGDQSGFFVFLKGSVSQLALLRQLEDSPGTSTKSPRFRRLHQRDGVLQLPRGFPLWKNDKEVETLRLGYIKPEVLSWSPRIILLHNFLSMEECEYLKAIGYPHLQNSHVVDSKTGKSFMSNVRTSSGMFLSSKDRKHPMVQAIEKRISIYAQVPVENGEAIQILRYEKNQYYEPHNDYFFDDFNLKKGGQRIATMLMYIGDNVEGGETYFPAGGSGECNCGGKIVKGISVKPIKGNAVLFWSMGLNGKSDPKSLHGACEVLSGKKWSAVKWMRERAFT
ncbi:prolyl 4-hydroxylase 1-like isoform X2 [Prosopis cineraria]|uniref:prolyl 4-hydroxylase 1-like isoform X2 n=1 Tax=Prosopis cineraria TaxID=364024 RepID=UPI00240F0A88|nr:prolyl 4-hydroxylase 1-like isoform X2 [Prosopis cineraria]